MSNDNTLDIEPEKCESCENEAVKPQIWAKLNSFCNRVDSQTITSDAFVIGRHSESDLAVSDPRLSSRHCRLLKKQDAEGRMVVVIEDNSGNGTFVNGKKVSVDFDDS